MGSARFTTGLFQVTINYAAANILVLAASTFVVLIVARAFIHHNAPKGTRLLPGPKGEALVQVLCLNLKNHGLSLVSQADRKLLIQDIPLLEISLPFHNGTPGCNSRNGPINTGQSMA